MREPYRHPVEDWIRALPEDDPGLAWRAALNARLASEVRRSPRRRLASIAPLAAVATAVLVAWLAAGLPRVEADRLGAELVAWHRSLQLEWEVAGPGLLPEESTSVRRSLPAGSAMDLEAL